MVATSEVNSWICGWCGQGPNDQCNVMKPHYQHFDLEQYPVDTLPRFKERAQACKPCGKLAVLLFRNGADRNAELKTMKTDPSAREAWKFSVFGTDPETALKENKFDEGTWLGLYHAGKGKVDYS